MSNTLEDLNAHLATEGTDAQASSDAIASVTDVVNQFAGSISTIVAAIADLKKQAEAGADFSTQISSVDQHATSLEQSTQKAKDAVSALQAQKAVLDSLIANPTQPVPDASGNTGSAANTPDNGSGTPTTTNGGSSTADPSSTVQADGSQANTNSNTGESTSAASGGGASTDGTQPAAQPDPSASASVQAAPQVDANGNPIQQGQAQ